MNLNQTFLVGSVVVHYYNYYNTQLALHYILLGSGEPIKKSNFRHVRSPTVVFAIKPTWARSRICARQLNAMGWHRRRYAHLPSAAWRRHMRWQRYVPLWAFVDFQHYVRRFSWLRKFFHSIIGLQALWLQAQPCVYFSTFVNLHRREGSQTVFPNLCKLYHFLEKTALLQPYCF